MKTNVVATSLLLSLGLSVASAGQPDARFYGTWAGVETYVIPPTVTRYFYHRGEATVKKSAVVVMGDSGQTLAVGQGLLGGRFEISPRWGKNTLYFRLRNSTVAVGARTSVVLGRNHGTLRLSADGNTLTETVLALLPERSEGRELNSKVTCNISGTFHRQGEEIENLRGPAATTL